MFIFIYDIFYIILFCYQLWDVIQDQQAADIISKESKVQEMSNKLLATALDKKTSDNVSVLVISLGTMTKGQQKIR